jgi:hypothetical protein
VLYNDYVKIEFVGYGIRFEHFGYFYNGWSFKRLNKLKFLQNFECKLFEVLKLEANINFIFSNKKLSLLLSAVTVVSVKSNGFCLNFINFHGNSLNLFNGISLSFDKNLISYQSKIWNQIYFSTNSFRIFKNLIGFGQNS